MDQGPERCLVRMHIRINVSMAVKNQDYPTETLSSVMQKALCFQQLLELYNTNKNSFLLKNAWHRSAVPAASLCGLCHAAVQPMQKDVSILIL